MVAQLQEVVAPLLTVDAALAELTRATVELTLALEAARQGGADVAPELSMLSERAAAAAKAGELYRARGPRRPRARLGWA